MTFDVAAVRREFPLLRDLTYLNTASNGLIPERARHLVERFFREHFYVESRSPYELFEVLASTRAAVAHLLGCGPEAIALTFNTSHGLNVAANSLPLEPGDNVVLAHGEFPANVYPWRNLESRGIEVRLIENPLLRADVDTLTAACDARTRVVAVSAVQFHDGYRPDLAALAAFCRERDIRTVVDGAQAIGACAIRPAALGVDFLASGGQKWLCAPRGTGFLYVRPALVQELRLPVLGWLNVDYQGRFDSLLRYPRDLYPDARRFELGTVNLHDVLMLRESLGLLNEIGIEHIEAHDVALAQRLRASLTSIPGVTVRAAGPRPSPIVAFAVPSERTPALREAFVRARIDASFREGHFRLSAHLYNDDADIDLAVETVAAALARVAG